MNSNRNSKKGKRGFKKLITGVIAAALAVVLCVTMIPQDVLAATADLDTSKKYTESLGDNASTEYAGRIWTDKSVYSEDATFEMFGGNKTTVALDTTKEDFLVAFSALATSQQISGKTQAPIDVVFVVDLSGSMSNSDSNMDNDKSRISNTIDAVNDSIDALMALNEYTRVGVVGFSNTYTELLPLDRYTKVGNNTGYFSLNRTTANDNYADLYVDAIGSAGNVIDETVDVEGGTNIQMGLYGGLNMLATEDSLYADVNGSQVKRIPTLILLSDGSPTYSSDGYESGRGPNQTYVASNWWAPLNNRYDGPGNSPYYGNGMKALMTGAYMKNAVDAHYGVAGTAYATNIYTIGMGITDLPNYETYQTGGGPGGRPGGGQTVTYYTGEQHLAYITLNPSEHWDHDNDMANAIRTAWDSYIAGNSPSVTVNSDNHTYTLSHPTSNDIYTNNNNTADDTALKDLVDGYYAADEAAQVTSVFDDILSNIIINTPEVPTEIKGTDATVDGYITYTDPIGQYMSVKDVKSILYAGQEFKLPDGYVPTKTTNGSTTVYTYKFTGTVNSSVYGNQSIEDIIITVTVEEDKDEVLTIKIPASVIPVRVNTVELDESGNPETHINNGAYPVRVIYSVGLQEGLKDTNGYIKVTDLSEDYIAKNTNADGTVNFYSNLFTGKEIKHLHADDGSEHVTTVGDTTVEFEPAHSNPFYYMQEDVPIYKNADGTGQVTAGEGLSDTKTYYYVMTYYHGTNKEVEVVARTGKQLKLTDIIVKGGYLYREKGSPRLNRILEFEGTKSLNNTNTANDFYLPTFVDGTETADAYDGKYVIYLGNNGVVNYAVGGNLEISKDVVIPSGLTGPADQTFDFTLDIDKNGTYAYHIETASGEIVSTGTIGDNGTFELADGQKIVITNLPNGTTYKVTEEQKDGFKEEFYDDADNVKAFVAGYEVNGTISGGTTTSEAFRNTYDVSDVTLDFDSTVNGTKILKGKPWADSDSFIFVLKSATYDTPMPTPATGDVLTEVTGSHKELAVTVTAADGTADSTPVHFDFGSIKYTEPGTYKYEISERIPTSNGISGVSYSGAMYKVVVDVTDNGDGTLSAIATMTKDLNDDGTDVTTTTLVTSAVFNNVYEPSEAYWIPLGTKSYTDTYGTYPITNGMFEFTMTGLTENGVKAPMPANADASTNSMTVRNVGHDVAYEAVKYHTADIGKTYWYEFKEVNSSIPGMTYDANTYYAKVVVTQKNSGEIERSVTYYQSDKTTEITGGKLVFINTYTPGKSDALIITGEKTLTGRDMKSGEVFTFTLSGVSDNAKALLNNNVISTTVANGTDGVAKDFAFAGIEFTTPGTYVFEVDEVESGIVNGVTYDEHKTTVTVEVKDVNGKLTATATYDNKGVAADADKAVFKNVYEPTFDPATAVTVNGKKVLNGKALVAGEFFFVVEPQNNAPMRAAHAAIPVDANGNAVLLDGVEYDQVGEYTYLVKEQIPTGATGNVYHGTTYDTSVYKIVVTVEDVNKDGKLTASWKLYKQTDVNTWTEITDSSGAKPVATFTNSYSATPITYAVPTLTKELIGGRATALQAGEFSFTMSAADADTQTAIDGGVVVLPTPATVTNDADGAISFDSITFKAAGTYKLKVVENGTDTSIMDYSDNVLTATFVVTDNQNGTLSVERRNVAGTYNFVNEYKTNGTFTFNIAKSFTGRVNNEWLATDKFAFEVVILDPATQAAKDAGLIVFPNIGNAAIPTGEIDNTVSADANGNRVSTSPAITINGPTYPGEPYKFVIREIAGSIVGVNYDETSYELAVTAVDNSNGGLTITTTLDGQPFDWQTGNILFENTYEPSSVELSGHQNLQVNKQFTGRADNAWLESDKFTFVLEKYGDTANDNTVTLPANASGLEVTNTNKAYAHFGNIKFTKTGTYYFKISEVDGQKDYITYDDTYYIVKVVVTDNTTAGVLEIVDGAITYTKNDTTTAVTSMDFTNIYSVTEKTVPVEVTKVLEGRNWTSNDKFEFAIEAANNEAVEGVTNGTVIMPANNLTITNSSVGSSAKGAFEITFKEPGTYHFHVTEIAGTDDNITYSTHTSHVTITVTDDKAGNLDIAVATAITGGLTFTNTFTPDPIDVPISGKKVLEGRTLNAGEFRFRMDAITENAPMPAVHNYTVANDASGNINFGTIRYTHEGTYQYRISEIMTPIAGVTFDGVDVIATVQVIKNASGELVPTVTYVKEDGSGTEFVFNNEYTTSPSSPVTISAHKTVSPTAGNTFQLNAGDFSFGIEPSENNPASDPVKHAIVQNGADGTVFFQNAVYEEPGTYVYTIHEVDGVRGGIIYDESVYTVTVVASEDYTTAKLVTDVTIMKGTEKVDSMTFNNGYNPKVATAIVHGHKHLLGGHKHVSDFTFDFTLTPTKVDGVEVTGQALTAKSTETGLFMFKELVFDKVGTYEYVMAEVKGSEPGMAYDTATHKVVVTVTDIGGELKAEVTIDTGHYGDGGASSEIGVFNNTYIPDATTVDIDGTKALNGRPISDGEFEFALIDADGKEIATKNVGNKFTFEDVAFDKAGTYSFTIVEKDTNALGVTYDLNTTYGVEVVIKDIGGQLDAESITYYKDGATIDADKVIFNNSYAAVNPATIQLGAAKTLTGRELKAGEFTFLLTGNDGTALTATNGADGSVLFDEIKYTTAGTYTYVITEAKGNVADVTYDGSKYTVTVVVKDDLKGNYVAEITSITESVAGKEIAANAVTFENAYTAPVPEGTSPKTNDIFNIWMLLAVICVAGFGFFGATVYSRRS